MDDSVVAGVDVRSTAIYSMPPNPAPTPLTSRTHARTRTHEELPLLVLLRRTFALSSVTSSLLISILRYRHCNESKVNRFGPSFATDLHCPNATALAAFEAAVKRNDIGWHAFPHNAEPEMYDPSLFLASLNITFREDEYYGTYYR